MMNIKEKCPKNYDNASFMHYAGILSSKVFLKELNLINLSSFMI